MNENGGTCPYKYIKKSLNPEKNKYFLIALKDDFVIIKIMELSTVEQFVLGVCIILTATLIKKGAVASIYAYKKKE